MKLLDLIQDCVADWGTDEDGHEMVVFGSWEEVHRAAKAILPHIPGATYEGGSFKLPVRTVEEGRALLGGLPFLDFTVHPKYGIYDRKGSIETELDSLLEYGCGVEMGFSDEYSRCSDCGVLVHTEAEHAWDNDRFTWAGYHLTCRKCCKDNPERFLEEYEPYSYCILKPDELEYALVGTWGDFLGKPSFDPLTVTILQVKHVDQALREAGMIPVFYKDEVAVPKGRELEARNIIHEVTK